MLAEFNSEIQTSMIDVTNSSITKLSDVSSIDNNILFSTNITTTIVSIMIDANGVAMTISSIIFKSKLIKSKMMRAYKD